MASRGIAFGPDVNLYRASANTLISDGRITMPLPPIFVAAEVARLGRVGFHVQSILNGPPQGCGVEADGAWRGYG